MVASSPAAPEASLWPCDFWSLAAPAAFEATLPEVVASLAGAVAALEVTAVEVWVVEVGAVEVGAVEVGAVEVGTVEVAVEEENETLAFYSSRPETLESAISVEAEDTSSSFSDPLALTVQEALVCAAL